MSPRSVVILGSTGSIGTQAIDVVARNPGRFRVVGLAAGGDRVELLATQALELGVHAVAVAKATAAQELQLAFYAEAQRRGWNEGNFALPKILAGPEAATELAAWPCDVVLNGMTGSVGLKPTLAALEAGRTLALANKESLIVGGPLVKAAARPGQIVPVDSEHSALAQALRGGSPSEVRRLVVTASGGPFRGRARSELTEVTPEQALAHPTWDMGPVVTINSATLVNKGLEVIEAHLLFDLPFDRIDVVVHPQSIVHSMVEFTDGSTLAQVSPPDMRLPIALGLGWPERVADAAPGNDWTKATTWTFEPLDDEAFPAVGLARYVGHIGGTAPAVFNAANEECVAAFLDGRLPFLGIVDTVAQVVAEHQIPAPGEGGGGLDLRNELTLADVLGAETWARARAQELTAGSGRLMQALGIVLFALAIGISIMLHEAGHMVTAKHYGMKVTQYFVGFGPSLWSFRRGETEYGVKAIPAGGFVKIIGMTPQEEIDDPADEPRAMWRAPIGERTVVLAAGSITHFLLAIGIIYIAAVFVGLPNPEFTKQSDAILQGTTVGYTAACLTTEGTLVDSATDCSAADVAAPATAGGLQAGDVVVSVNGTATDEWSDVTAAILAAGAGKPIPFVVERDGVTKTLQITPRSFPKLDVNGNVVKGKTVARVGVGPQQPTAAANVTYGPIAAVPATFEFTWQIVEGTFSAIKSFPSKIPGLVDAITGQPRDPNGPISVVGASRIGGDAAEIGGRSGTEAFLLILASLNLFIGIFNLFPLLPLDGGHIAVIWYEKLRSWWANKRGKPDPGRVDYQKLMPLTFAVIILFGAISVLAITADIVNPIRLN